MRLSSDADEAPDPADWLTLDEGTRMALVQPYHSAKRLRMPKPMVHTALHTVVETQIAMGAPIPSRGVLQRLMAEGLDRHDAVYAIGSVLAGHLFNLLSKGPQEGDPNTAYYQELEQLTAEKWRKSAIEQEKSL
jgi:hypothetical protein